MAIGALVASGSTLVTAPACVGRGPASDELGPLSAQKRPIDLLLVELDVMARDVAAFEVCLPAVDDARDAPRLINRSVAVEPEQARHRQRVRERRVGLVLADAHLLKAERLSGRRDVVRRGKLVLLRIG